MQSVTQHGPAILQVLAFRDQLGPLDQLAQVAGIDLGVFGGIVDYRSVISKKRLSILTLFYNYSRFCS